MPQDQWTPNLRYPDPYVTALDPRFNKYKLPLASVKRLNSPNDVVVKSDGSIWFTDPRFGILGNYEGDIAEPELPMNVYRVDGKTGAVTVVADGINAPNGLCFTPDENKLYIVESRSEPRRILVYDVVADGSKIANGKILIDSG